MARFEMAVSNGNVKASDQTFFDFTHVKKRKDHRRTEKHASEMARQYVMKFSYNNHLLGRNHPRSYFA